MGWYISWGLCVGLQNRPVFCSNRTIYQETIYRLEFVCRVAEQANVLLKTELSIRWLSIGWGFSGMDVKQDSVLIAIRYVLLDFRQNGHEKWYVYLLHFVVNCIALCTFSSAFPLNWRSQSEHEYFTFSWLALLCCKRPPLLLNSLSQCD